MVPGGFFSIHMPFVLLIVRWEQSCTPYITHHYMISVKGAVLEQATKEWRGAEGGELPGGAVREHLALQTHLSAMEAFNDWFDHFHKGQPVRPVLAEGASFTEKVAHEQRERVYQGDMERWRGGQVSALIH